MPTYTQIGSAVTVGSGGAANIDFTSIPSTYTDLVIVGSLRSDGAVNTCKINFNNNSTNYSNKRLYGTGSSAASDSAATTFASISAITESSFTANTFGSFYCYIPNYAGSTNKSSTQDGVNETNATAAVQMIVASLWSDTAAINRVTLAPTSGNFVQYSTAYLYGVSNA